MADPLGLIFDLDGTLIDSAPDIHMAANRVLAEESLPALPFETVRGFIGNGVGVLMTRILASQGLSDDTVLHHRMVASFIDLYEEAVHLTELYPDVRAALAHLADAGHPMAICTNKPEAPARSVLRHFGLDRFFPVIIGGDSLAQRKPDPAPLLAARSALKTGRILFVGDSEVDAETARHAAIPFALFSEGYRKTAAQDLGAKVIFGSYAALPALVSHLGGRI